MANETPRFDKKSLLRKLPAVLLVAAVAVAATVWGTNARYVHQNQEEAVVKAKEFYFTSDYLVPGGARYELNPGTTDVTFHLRNYEGLKVSELDVNYTVTVGETELDSGKIVANKEKDESITLENMTPGVEYTVTAASYTGATPDSGYTKTISATFVVKSAKEQIYKNTQHFGDYVLLTVWTQGKAGTAAVTVPTGLIPDRTDPALEKVVAEEGFEVSLGANESASFRFFVAKGYGGGDIPVTVGNESLSETALN